MENSPISVALAAYGMSGSVFHAPLITAHQGFRLHTVLERSGSRRAQKKYPEVKTVKRFDEILEDSDIELVVINTPEYTHYELAAEALRAGKHVVIEKAVTPSSEEARALIALAKNEGRMLSVFHNSRWHGDFLTIKSLLKNKLLGRLVEAEIHYDRYRNAVQEGTWKETQKPGTGSLYNLGSHMIDQALVLFGWPLSVWGDLRIQRPGGKVCDNFEVVLNYDHLKVTLKSSYLVREPGPRYQLHGTEGSFLKYGADPQESCLKAGKSPREADWGKEAEAQWGQLNTSISGLHFEGKLETIPGSYLGFYDNIYQALREKADLEVKPEQALMTILIIEAAIKSNETKSVVPPDPFVQP